MIRELTSEDVVDISLFIRDNSIKENPAFFLSCFNSANEFILRNLRNAFFGYRIQAFGTIYGSEINDIVIFQRPERKQCSFITLVVCRIMGGELLAQTITSVFLLNKEICKIKAIVSSSQLEAGFRKTLTEIGFVEELLLRSFPESSNNIYSYAIFRNEEVQYE